LTLFDLLFVFLLFVAAVTLIASGGDAIRGRPVSAIRKLKVLFLGTVVYIAIVYVATALSKPVVHALRDPQCSDDWCLDVEGVDRNSRDSKTLYTVHLRIFSRSKARPQRELIAKDVYLFDSQYHRFNPTVDGTEVPLDTLLQPGQSIETKRVFEVPAESGDLRLRIEHRDLIPICLIIGECEAFHQGPSFEIAC